MRLYPLNHTPETVKDPEFGLFHVQEHGGFDFPDELSDRLHRHHVRGQKLWETQVERDKRLHGEEDARRRDPATMYDAVARLVELAERSGGAQAQAPDLSKLSPEQLAELAEAVAAAQGSGKAPAKGRTTAKA